MNRFIRHGLLAVSFAFGALSPAFATPLRYAPPFSINPLPGNVVTATVVADQANTDIQIFPAVGIYPGDKYPDTQDVLLVFPTTAEVKDRIIVKGGRRIVAIGGKINYTGSGSPAFQCIYMGPDSIVYLEGLAIDVSGSYLVNPCTGAHEPSSDALNFHGDSYGSPNVFIQNCKITGVKGLYTGHHGDGIQFTGNFPNHCINGRGRLYVGNCDIDSSYQGAIVTKQTYHKLDYTLNNDFENVYFTYNDLSPGSEWADGKEDAVYIYWSTSLEYRKCNYVSLRNVWMNPWRAEGQTITVNHIKPNKDVFTKLVDGSTSYVSAHPYLYGAIFELPAGDPGKTMLLNGTSGIAPGVGYANAVGYMTSDTSVERTDPFTNIFIYNPNVNNDDSQIPAYKGVGQVGTVSCSAVAAFNEQATVSWDSVNKKVTGFSTTLTAAGSTTASYYEDGYWYIDFGENYAALRITGLWTRYRPSTTGDQVGSLYMRWSNDRTQTVPPGTELPIVATGFKLGSATGAQLTAAVADPNFGQKWVQDADFSAQPVAPKARYLIVRNGTGDSGDPVTGPRANEFAITAFKVFQ